MTQLMHSFRGYIPPPEVIEGVRRGEIAAFCLFAYNVQSPAQLRALTDALHEAAREGGHHPPLLGIDQEGGQLIAVTGGATELPGNMALGATRSPELAEQAGKVLARELLAMGCNLNFAPSLDINNNPDNPVVGARAFGDHPALVSQLGCAMIRGIQAEGVIATAKHFPGHGDTSGDSHFLTPSVSRTLDEMQALELLPFRDAIAEGVGAVMTGHIAFPALDGETPATLSARILDGLLRREMGFDGLIITDAMDMQAVASRGAEESLAGALRAGADLVLMGHLPDQFGMMRRLQPLVNPDSTARIQQAREHLSAKLLPPDVIGCAEHQRIAQDIADASITLVRDQGQLTLRPAADTHIVVITPRPSNLTPADTSSSVDIRLAEAVRKRHARTTALELPARPDSLALREILQVASSADVVIVGTICADQDAGQAALVNELHARGCNPIVVAMRTPYDLRAFPQAQTYLCAYSIRAVTMEATARVLFGEIPARGVLPCAIPGIAASGEVISL